MVGGEYRTILKQYRQVLHAWQKETRDPFVDKQVAERFMQEILDTKEKKVELRYHQYMHPLNSL